MPRAAIVRAKRKYRRRLVEASLIGFLDAGTSGWIHFLPAEHLPSSGRGGRLFVSLRKGSEVVATRGLHWLGGAGASLGIYFARQRHLSGCLRLNGEAHLQGRHFPALEVK